MGVLAEADGIDFAASLIERRAGPAPPDPANAVAAVESAPPSYHGPERPDRDGMLAAVRDYVGEVCRRFPLLRIRHAIYSFEDRRRSFANTAGVRRQERRAVHRFSGGNPNHKLDFSGIAKNSFYVEDGEIRFPLIETMVSGNFQDLLMNIRGVSSESINFGGGEFPYLLASGVMISRPRAAADAPPAESPVSTAP